MKYRVYLMVKQLCPQPYPLKLTVRKRLKNKALEIADHGNVVWDYMGLVDGFPIEVDKIRGE